MRIGIDTTWEPKLSHSLEVLKLSRGSSGHWSLITWNLHQAFDFCFLARPRRRGVRPILGAPLGAEFFKKYLASDPVRIF
jgi:hypothetical protein